MHKGWLWNAQLNNRLVYYQGRFLYAKLNLQIKIFILCVVLIIANNIDQILKVERTTKNEIKIGKM
jgi:DNA gyrase/topoisomerase IV subunit A